MPSAAVAIYFNVLVEVQSTVSSELLDLAAKRGVTISIYEPDDPAFAIGDGGTTVCGKVHDMLATYTRMPLPAIRWPEKSAKQKTRPASKFSERRSGPLRTS
ncbi:hypothetical protein N7454_002917 [Penicillium verhagenii]|nr:hypothetical protein N7454_002917 [Penicillium verhagenii]